MADPYGYNAANEPCALCGQRRAAVAYRIGDFVTLPVCEACDGDALELVEAMWTFDGDMSRRSGDIGSVEWFADVERALAATVKADAPRGRLWVG